MFAALLSNLPASDPSPAKGDGSNRAQQDALKFLERQTIIMMVALPAQIVMLQQHKDMSGDLSMNQTAKPGPDFTINIPADPDSLCT